MGLTRPGRISTWHGGRLRSELGRQQGRGMDGVDGGDGGMGGGQ